MSQEPLVCPRCGQQLPGDPACRPEAVVCSTCGQTVQPGALVSLPPDAGSGGRTPSVAGMASGFFSHRKGEVLGFFTPILVLLAMIVGAFTWFLAFVLCPLLGYFVSLKLCQRALRSGGRPAFKRYAISTLLGFVFWPLFWIFLVGFLGSLSAGDEVVAGGDALGGGLAVVAGLIAFGCAFLCWAIAAVWCWRSVSHADRPPVPSERVSDVVETRRL